MKRLLFFALLLPLLATSQIISSDSSSINFGVVMVGSTDSSLVTLTNNSVIPLNVTNIKFYSIYGEVPFSTSQSTFSIPGNGTQSVWIYFSPVQNVLHNSTMVVQHNANSGHEAILLMGQGRFPLAYYNLTENLTEEALKLALKTRIAQGYIQLSYNAARDAMFMTIDNKRQNGQNATVNTLECVYTGFNKTSYTSRSNAQGTSPNFNTEHTFPQGFFNSNLPMRSDIHHLYPTTNNSNSQRGNKPFGVVTGGTPVTLGGGSFFNNTTFEPRNVQKGQTARAMMYFVIRYQDYSNHFSVQQNILKNWHNTYAVDSIEERRNNDIFIVQGNRNPFVDYPQLEKRITNFVANSVAPSQPGLDVVQSSINFGTFFAQTQDTFDYVLVNRGNTVINFSNFNLTNTALLSFAAGSGINSSLNPGNAIEISIIAQSNNTTTISESLTFTTNLTFPLNSFSVPITGQTVIVGIDDNNLNSQLELYPNPVQEQLYIRTAINQELDLLLLDLTGKRIDFGFLKGNDGYILPTKEISSGLYFLQINNGKEQIIRKIIKQ
ncbi:endonuclease [Vicingaceae bacterium]|nr:endonuclease [Vicingaceae bacterium]MDB4060529.1 endonuclease [Vicingaceae bacterium]